MSFNRENVIWESENGTWNRGFYTVHDRWSDDDDFDPEWDVDYDFSSFEWVSTGHPTADAAHASWDGANPGGYSLMTQSTAADACKELDALGYKLLTR